jgi:hypothetical protein
MKYKQEKDKQQINKFWNQKIFQILHNHVQILLIKIDAYCIIRTFRVYIIWLQKREQKIVSVHKMSQVKCNRELELTSQMDN